MTGRLEVYCGSMFADKSTNLQRQAKRHTMAGRKVVTIKPDIDNRYSEDEMVTHDGIRIPALSIRTDARMTFTHYKAIKAADVVLVDEVQFFTGRIIVAINAWLEEGKTVYVAGLDMDKDGLPFGTTSTLMGLAETVHKVQAVCRDCGNDAWVTIQEKETERIHVGNDGYKPVCRKCSYKYLGGPKSGL
jgi:thymidine kinase